jgi:hypothetical protein
MEAAQPAATAGMRVYVPPTASVWPFFNRSADYANAFDVFLSLPWTPVAVRA